MSVNYDDRNSDTNKQQNQPSLVSVPLSKLNIGSRNKRPTALNKKRSGAADRDPPNYKTFPLVYKQKMIYC